jgi:hypothetical protein
VQKQRTEHSASLILLAPLLRDVAGHSQVDDRQVFSRILIRIEATEDRETFSVGNFIASFFQIRSKTAKRECFPADLIAIEFQI